MLTMSATALVLLFQFGYFYKKFWIAQMDINETENKNTGSKVDTLEAFKKRLNSEKTVFDRNFGKFIEIENELDQRTGTQIEISGRRRKSFGNKSFEFISVSYKEAMEDINSIYDSGNTQDSRRTQNFKKFKKSDFVTVAVEKKKYKGTIIQVGHRGLIVKSKDRRKIKISWEQIDEQEIQIYKN